MYLRNRLQLLGRKPEDVEPQLVELLADRLLVQDADDGVLAVNARHDRDAEVDRLPRQPQLEAAVLRHALLGDVELRHDLDARDDRAVEAPIDRAHRRLQHAVDAILHVHGVVARLDVDVARPPLNRGVDRRVHQPDDRARVGGQLVDGELIVAGVVLAEQLELEALGRLLEDARRALALLEDRLDRRRRPDGHLDRRREQERQLVDHRQVRGVGHDDHEIGPFTAIRNEPVSQHQVRGNRAEQVVVDAEPRRDRRTRGGSAPPAGARPPLPRRAPPRWRPGRRRRARFRCR